MTTATEEVGDFDERVESGEIVSADERPLWQALRTTKSREARAALIVRYMDVVRSLARAVYRNSEQAYVDYRDLMQLGAVGLLEALPQFDPDGPASFRTFASKRIRGAMLDGLQQASELHAQNQFRKRFRAERVKSLYDEGKAAQNSDVFAQMVEFAVGIAIGHMVEGTALYQTEEQSVTDDEKQSEVVLLLTSIRNLVESLAEPERQIVRYHYFDGLPLATIAKMLGVSAVRVSQLHARAIQRLRVLQRRKAPLNLEI